MRIILTTNEIITNYEIITLFFYFNNLLFKPSTIGLIFYVMYRIKAKTKVSKLEYFLSLSLIYQLGLLTEVFINIDFYQLNLINYTDYILNVSDNNENLNKTGQLNDNIPRHHENPDLSRMIRYISGNVAALMMKNPKSRVIGVFATNSYNLIADIISNEEKANYWIDQYNYYSRHGRMRGGADGIGPFERGFNPFNPNGPDDDSSGGSSNISSLIDSSNSSDKNFIQNLLSPVDHSIPLETLINQHFLIILGLFFIALAFIILTIFLYLDLFILLNKDYLLNKLKNKYLLMYVKFVLFRKKVDMIIIGLFNLFTWIFFAYCLHYIITHPIQLS